LCALRRNSLAARKLERRNLGLALDLYEEPRCKRGESFSRARDYHLDVRALYVAISHGCEGGVQLRGDVVLV
jgi:hypothetical protein